MGASVQFKVMDAILSRTSVQDLNHSLRMLAQVTLSRALDGKTAIIIQTDRKIINMHLQVITPCLVCVCLFVCTCMCVGNN